MLAPAARRALTVATPATTLAGHPSTSPDRRVYRHCIFCHGSLGANEAIEHFPVGRRLAFDAAKGRLWVVCARCERWNLTPLDERWEAVEECERAFRDARLRVSSEHVGLARLGEGLELVRIGAPQRPELAAWRYGDQFGRRRVRHARTVAGAVVAGGALFVGAPFLAAALGVGMVLPLLGTEYVFTHAIRKREEVAVTIPLDDGRVLGIARADFALSHLLPDGDGARLLVVTTESTQPVGRDAVRRRERQTVEVRGADLVRVAGAILPHLNAAHGSRGQVREAVRLLEAAPSTADLVRDAAVLAKRRFDGSHFPMREAGALGGIAAPLRLALEMAAHEDQERRALDGELAELERAWRDAEEIAAIADGLIVPSGFHALVQRVRGG